MCYSAQIWADFRKYERLGGTLSVKEFTKLAGWTRKKGTWVKAVPRALRQAMTDATSGRLPIDTVEEARAADAEAIALIAAEIGAQEARLAEANAKLASPKPTKAAENARRVATNKIAAGKKKLEEMAAPPPTNGIDRMWPGQFAPVMIRDPKTGERTIVPMRYRCRLPGWTEADEAAKPGSYNARRDKLSTVWRRVFGYNHGIMVANQFYESVYLHDLQQRALAPGEREQNVELMFTPRSGQDLYVACLWTCVEGVGDEPGFYTFAAITDDPPPEVAAAGHDRFVIPIREGNIDTWLNPDPNALSAQLAILDDRERPYYEHEIVPKE
ncbi:SOS response-associated peptidase family protein [Frateuria terrea]|uniref:SOS response associated peptidase (SRAP) n=1 Tax=Frateuria terrea TaxID=529704 RepID=A0A1H6VP49_9GAMM|nr:SOS response-associated peptidase family protein [Frateuria terrea]SEJ03527.1 SOS response associated peptidase (SRAP) [Frateuria terrea]SFP63873.1 SOS response associated peptidase (SRAP) [Frateuria terrea]